ncbi:transcription factor-like protein DPA isoform X1 [Herrania umbratica]|uniref:Transcription factor-like protein DPA isoform X1 n=1 Tax=Herrania umbratica TaxID=108875 RepID=A0A6J1ARS8_9ROSI|nr:transcription factor-like protein DPA isoform X1 [Herrania umbratica]XP_021289600.1 transcription factor-like protein DPA isoform X1 [Herrania umbratica]
MDNPYLEDSPSCEQSPVATPSNASTSGSACGMNQSAVKQKNASADVVDGTMRKKVSRMPGGGLRQFSVMVCKKLESKGSTTYAEVADEIIEEFATAQTNTARSLDEFHEKNVRRRVYDALNVLMALDIITREKKEIRWKGLSTTTQAKSLEELKALHVQLMARIAKKAAYLKDVEEQIAGLQNIIERNQQLLKKSSAPKEGFTLPFILVQTSPHATVEIEISEDMQLVHLDFNSTPFSLHDDAYVLKLMRYYQRPESRNTSQSSSIHSSSSSCKATRVSKPFYWNSETETPR